MIIPGDLWSLLLQTVTHKFWASSPSQVCLLSLCLLILFIRKQMVLLSAVSDANVSCELLVCFFLVPLCCKLNPSNNFSNSYGLRLCRNHTTFLLEKALLTLFPFRCWKDIPMNGYSILRTSHLLLLNNTRLSNRENSTASW